MTFAARFSCLLQFVIRELLNATLRPLWLSDLAQFEAALDSTDCYPFRVCYSLGERRQLWFEAPHQQTAWEELA
jgi:hypothetical protein